MGFPRHHASEVGRRVLHLRRALGFESAKSFADAIGVKPQELSAWERGERRPGIAKTVPMMERYGITLDWLYLGIVKSLPHDLLLRIEQVERMNALRDEVSAPTEGEE